MCCSQQGECGPFFDDLSRLYRSQTRGTRPASELFDEFCTNNTGDWRFVECEEEEELVPILVPTLCILITSFALVACLYYRRRRLASPLQLLSSGLPPVLDIDGDKKYHIFLSHVRR